MCESSKENYNCCCYLKSFVWQSRDFYRQFFSFDSDFMCQFIPFVFYIKNIFKKNLSHHLLIKVVKIFFIVNKNNINIVE